jgi:exonuclease SbcD
MKIVHTSDWHLGQRFFGESRETEHRAFLDWLVNIIDRDDIDALVISGDIFDIKNPPSYAKRLYNDFLAKTRETKCKNIIIIGGNHDSSLVLDEQKKLLKPLKIFIVGGGATKPEDTIFKIERDNKLIGVISAIAYLSETNLRDSKKSSEERDRAKELENAIARYYKRAYRASKRAIKNRNLPLIATGHLSTLRREHSESVRDIYIGKIELFDKKRFPPFDYIALGHYHRRVVSKNIAYSGSPIILSFDEAKHKKYILEVDISADNLNIKDIEVPKFRDLFTLEGDILDIEKRLKELKLNSPIKPAFVQLKLNPPKNLMHLNSKIDELTNLRKDIKILKVIVKKISDEIMLDGLEDINRLENISPEGLFLKRLEAEDFTKEAREKLLNRFIQIKNMVELDEN